MSDEMEQKQEENLVKKTCKELGITQKQLAEKTGITERSLTNWANGKVKTPKSFFKTVELLKKAEELKILKQSLSIISN
jgi:transcriptional regulator with XRE-family HTH domain